MERGDDLREEVKRLRDWRHSFLNEWFAMLLSRDQLEHMQKRMAEELEQLRGIVNALDTKIEAIIDLSERQTAVAEALAERGPQLPLGWVAKGVALVASLSAVGGFLVLLVTSVN